MILKSKKKPHFMGVLDGPLIVIKNRVFGSLQNPNSSFEILEAGVSGAAGS